MKHSDPTITRIIKSTAAVAVTAAMLSAAACSVPNKKPAVNTSEISGLNSSIFENTQTSKLHPDTDDPESSSPEQSAASTEDSSEPDLEESSEEPEGPSELSFEESSQEEPEEISKEEPGDSSDEEPEESRTTVEPEQSQKPPQESSIDPSTIVEASEELHEESSQVSETEESEAHVHSFGKYTVTKEASCTDKGTMTAVCKCGATAVKDIPPLGHDYQIVEKTSLEIVRKCTRCGDRIVEKTTPRQPVSIKQLDVTVENEHTYDGQEFRPKVTVTDHGKDITYSCNVVYDKNAVKPGYYTLTVNMNGYYCGSESFGYRIFPAAPVLELEDQSDTSCKVSWSCSGNADLYLLEYDITDKFEAPESMTVEGDESSCVIEGLEKGTKYFIRMNSVNEVYENGVKKHYVSYHSNVVKKGGPHIEVKNGVTYVDGILIANKTYSLPSDYAPGLTAETQRAFNDMAAAAAKDGLYLYIISGYRSYWTQASTYNYFVNDRGKAQADRVSARPGHSEHQSGLAIDVNTTANSFAGTPEAIWLEKNCWKYGFVIRYPKGKEAITGYIYEPWHVRYLGKENAKKVYDSGLCLEEYLGITSAYQ